MLRSGGQGCRQQLRAWAALGPRSLAPARPARFPAPGGCRSIDRSSRLRARKQRCTAATAATAVASANRRRSCRCCRRRLCSASLCPPLPPAAAAGHGQGGRQEAAGAECAPPEAPAGPHRRRKREGPGAAAAGHAGSALCIHQHGSSRQAARQAWGAGPQAAPPTAANRRASLASLASLALFPCSFLRRPRLWSSVSSCSAPPRAPGSTPASPSPASSTPAATR